MTQTPYPYASNGDYTITVTHNGENVLGVEDSPVNQVVMTKAEHEAYLPENPNGPSLGAYVINDIIKAFSIMRTEEILDGWDIQVEIDEQTVDYYGNIIADVYEPQKFYLIGYQGEAFLTNDYFGQLLLPLGQSKTFLRFLDSQPMDKSWASYIASSKETMHPLDGKPHQLLMEADDLRDLFYATHATRSSLYYNLQYEGSVRTMEFSPDLLVAVERENRKLGDSNGVFTVTKKRPFSWYPEELRGL